VAINCIPTSVHTIAGVVSGQWLLGENKNKTRTLLIWGGVTLLLGFSLDWTNITPIIKRIATSSFTLASLGYCLLALSACYWWIDEKNHRKGLQFFTIIGMNSIFIYLFFEIMAGRWFNDYVQEIVQGLLGFIHVNGTPALLLGSLAIFGLEWGICLFLYRKKIFFRL
jgi:predicted acyltransferase